MRKALTATEQAYRLDVLDPMSANLLALARMAAGHIADAIPVFEELVERMPTMSFPVSRLLRAHAFQHDVYAAHLGLVDEAYAVLEGAEVVRQVEQTQEFRLPSLHRVPPSIGRERYAR
jgi:hypothetical protein